MLMLSVCFAMAQGNQASIKFDKVVHNFGTFSEDAPTQKCVFTFTNTGTAPLIPSLSRTVSFAPSSATPVVTSDFVISTVVG